MIKRMMLFIVLTILAGTLLACQSAQAGSTGADTADQPAQSGADSTAAETSGEPIKITLGAYTTPREAYGKLIPIFQAQWKKKTGQEVVFEESYLGSGAQSRAIVEGFEADIAALSLEADIIRIEDAGLITHDWRDTPYKGIVSTSIAVLGVRAGNPLGVADWDDLAQPGVEILTPNPKTSGGAMWNILAFYGAAKRGFIEGVAKDDDAAAQEFLLAVLNNVYVMDKGARESITNYEQGIGDIIITYENEIMVGQQAGQDYEYVIPRSTILIENPIAVIDTYVDKHGNREAVEAFVDFLFTPEAQTVFAESGLRSVDPAVAAATAENYPEIEDLFTIGEFGGWKEATPTFFGDDGIFTQTVGKVQRLAQ